MLSVKYISTYSHIKKSHHEFECLLGLQYNAITYIKRGKVTLYTENGNITGQAPCIIIFPCNMPYKSIWEGETVEFSSINFEAYYNNIKFLNSLGFRSVDLSPEKNEAVNNLFFNANEDEFIKTIYLTRFITKLMLKQKNTPFKRQSDIVSAAKNYIEQNYKQNFKIGEIAKKLNVSESYLFHTFKSEVGCSPIEYKNNIRIRIATELLCDKSNTVDSIAESLGFCSTPYFLKTFKKATGKSTEYYRKNSLM